MPNEQKTVGYTTFSINVEAAATRIEQMAGRDYLVGPAVIAREGVMNRVLYTAYELQRSLRTWNGRPVILRHSYDADGKPISANSPEVISQQGLGFMFNTTWGADKKLRTEVWLSMDDIKAGKIPGIDKDGKITGNVLELSTGIFHQYMTWNGEFEGEAFDIEAYDLVGDHLALLPDQTGAYSVKAGAGFPRWNVSVNTDKSAHSAIFEYVRQQKGELVSVADNFFVYSKGGLLYKHTHCNTEGVFTPSAEQETQVTQVTEYVSANQKPQQETPPMPAETTPKEKTISDFSKDEVIAAFNASVTADELQTIAAAKIPWLADAKRVYDEQRTSLIDAIAANSQNTFTKEELAAMPQAMLTKLGKLAANAATPPKGEEEPAAPRFDAAGAPLATNAKQSAKTAVTVDTLPEPILTFKK